MVSSHGSHNIYRRQGGTQPAQPGQQLLLLLGLPEQLGGLGSKVVLSSQQLYSFSSAAGWQDHVQQKLDRGQIWLCPAWWTNLALPCLVSLSVVRSELVSGLGNIPDISWWRELVTFLTT